jgi:hypothetical protein
MTEKDHEMSAPADEAAPTMEVDSTGDTDACRNKPYYGTKRYYKNVKATVPGSTTIKELNDEYKKYAFLKR